jgi:Leucine-rich repeat (LRR) protein
MQLAVPWLTELDVSNNDIRDDGFVSLTVCLQLESCSLKKLNCANNSLTGLSCKMLCAVLELNCSLLYLNLDDNVSCLICFLEFADKMFMHSQILEKGVFDLLHSSGNVEVTL